MAILRTSRSRIATAAVATLAVVGLGTFGAMRVNANAPEKAAAPLTEVDVATVVPQTVTDWQSYSGRLEAVEKVDVRPQVSGTIVAVNFKDGALVKKGDVLFVIDPRPYQAEVDRAAAQLAAAQARNGYAQSDWQRAQRLIGDNAIAKRDYDEKQNAAREAAANLKAAEAALETARINLGYTRITAPVSGRVSRAEITLGNVVSAGASAPPLTTLVSVSPIYASFDADEQTYLQYINGARNGRKVPVELGLANETGYSRSGEIDSVDNRLDTSSGTIRVRARFDNADGTLVPGLYARVKVGGSAPHAALLVDDAAINTDQDKKFVFVVDQQGRVSYREVQPGMQHGNQRVIVSGLAAGDRVIVNGTQRVRPGEQVKPHMVPMTGGDAPSAPIASTAKPAAPAKADS
ncbi:multidrug efflux RND transporter periplasmic adaptor subunit CeoA [Burkholderia multivorans]|jgi:multidrug efflux system membrane fusion protein|uniref:RND family efflux transporter MFP subunit n=3 Tax=Burkholderia multivorans TaxID=87883 RepID=A0A0H3KTQ2_BURM1|nr:multidrug efflux RND transporter periplasmic adaptor subunit CeoA [Burkholderia multivorans]ABX17057.1 efflux transporter, RND family, MFP subunit [Burkholderia multivorans ATCC 17616]AIO72465.1 efflux transporter, RND family, MFP subunit [Burkholderia multivorans]AJY16676.1 efflux transporter, RND family, MFP subunit [Burkholderia multivorans ATCC BAA-247]AOJ94859.1 hemolysin secretion protein D [Burkholderia multivorans]AOK65771.1 hemolysin secretion protein D [Burkholderia multivorans]